MRGVNLYSYVLWLTWFYSKQSERYVKCLCTYLDAQPLPAEPRYASLPNIMKAKKKPIEKLTPADLGIDLTPRIETIKVSEPPKRVGGGKVRRFPSFVAANPVMLVGISGGECGRAHREAQGSRYYCC